MCRGERKVVERTGRARESRNCRWNIKLITLKTKTNQTLRIPKPNKERLGTYQKIE